MIDKSKLSEVFSAAKKMQEAMKTAQTELENTEESGEAGGGIVKISVNGKYDITDINLSEAILTEPLAVIETLLKGAYTQAKEKIDIKTKSQLGDIYSKINSETGL